MVNVLQFKRPILLAFLSLAVTGNVLAQDRKVRFGIQLGATVSKFAVTASSPNSEYKGPYSVVTTFNPSSFNL